MTKVWAVHYRTGGTANYKWHRTLDFRTEREALQAVESIEHGGRVAYYEETPLKAPSNASNGSVK